MGSAKVTSVNTDDESAELSIGQVATMSRLTIRALRHYDDIGLLRPARVDPSSGYRYYTPDQVTIAGTIAMLRGLDVDTTTIAALLDGSIDVEAVIEQELHRLARIEQQRRDTLDVLGSLRRPLGETLTVAQLDAFSILGRHARVPVSDDVALVGQAFDELFTSLDAASVEHDGDGICVIHRTDRDELWLDLGVRTTHRIEPVDGYRYLDIGAGLTASLIHHGPLASLPLGHARLAAWAHNNALQPTGPARETYLGPLDDQRTEIAFLVSNQ